MYDSSPNSASFEPCDRSEFTESAYADSRTAGRASTNIDHDVLHTCPKLQGSGNYEEWYDWLINHVPVPHRPMLTGEWKEPKEPDRLKVSDEMWHTCRADKARWNLENMSLARFIERSVDDWLVIYIEDCSLASEVMSRLEQACRPPLLPVDVAIARFDSLLKWSFDQASSFNHFIVVFEARFDHFNNMRGGWKICERQKCFHFWKALGPRFQKWKDQTDMIFCIAGFGESVTGLRALGYDELKQRAGVAWVTIKEEEDERLRAAHIQSVAMNRQQRQRRQRRNRRERRELRD